MKRLVAIATDDPGWHGARLREAFLARGFDPHYVALQECSIHLNEPDPIRLPGIDMRDLAGVFVRGVPAGTLQEVVFYLDILHALRESGILVYNDARAVERSVDKLMTSFLLVKAGIPTLPTWTVHSLEQARAVAMREFSRGHELVYKPLFGSQGEGLLRIARIEDLPSPEISQGIYYLQQFVDAGEGNWHDWRVFVIGGRAVAAMRRSGTTWINNVAQGGRCETAPLEDELCRLAQDATRALDMHYAGVDVIRDRAGKLHVLEVNSVPAWRGLQSTTQLAMAQLLADDFLALSGEFSPVEMAG